MGHISRPTWCFSDTPFYPLPGVDHCTGALEEVKTSIFIQYSDETFHAKVETSAYVACENF